jgi:hypothetical protein
MELKNWGAKLNLMSLCAIKVKTRPIVQISSKFKLQKKIELNSNWIWTLEVIQILIQNLFQIWRSLNKESCSSAQELSNHILFQIFWLREDQFWTKSSLNEIESF